VPGNDGWIVNEKDDFWRGEKTAVDCGGAGSRLKLDSSWWAHEWSW